MKPTSLALLVITLISFLAPTTLRAQDWPPFEQYVSKCFLIVKARQVGPFKAQKDSVLSFQVTETWKGKFDTNNFVKTSPEGYLLAGQGENGARVIAGQEVVFFFTLHGQPEGKLAHHTSASPITGGRLIYGSTNSPATRRIFTTAECKQVIADLSAPAKKPPASKK